MARVCTDWFPKGTRKYQKEDGFYMDDELKANLDICIKNIRNDWDFTIIISGEGEVRVGKSVLAQQIGAYLTWKMWKDYGIKLPFNVHENFVFEGDKLIQFGNELGKKHPYSTLIFDEAGSDLDGKKVMQSSTQAVLDYFRECGQYNMFNILVLPDFFTLPKGIALSRSIFLINVTYHVNEEGFFERGDFYFYSRAQKKFLYLYGKRDLNYTAARADFRGKFYNFYAIDEQAYRDQKQVALAKRETKKRNKFQYQRDACWHLFHKELGWSYDEIGKRMEQLTGIFVGKSTISDGLSHFKAES